METAWIMSVDALVLGRKAFQSAEAYVLGVFHLYFTVYYHKTTRGAEKMLSALLHRIGELVHDNRPADSGLDVEHPIIRFLSEESLEDYLKLDDFLFWTAFQSMARAKDEIVRELSQRLLERQLYKATDVTARLRDDVEVARFRTRLTDARKAGEFGPYGLLEDSASRSPYKRRGAETPEALSKVFIRRPDGTGFEDLRDASKVVGALEDTTVFRVYTRDQATTAKVEKLMEED
jgi:hypothetical protein